MLKNLFKDKYKYSNNTGIYKKMSKIILIEGKKEEVAKKLKDKFEYDTRFIDQVLNIDPTGYKYIDYLARQLEKMIVALQGPKGGLTYLQGQALYDVFSQIIPWFHTNYDRINVDDIWKAETKFRERHGTFDNINNLVDNPKDINQYTNPAFLETLIDIVDSKKSKKEIERELKSQAEKLFEDDEVLVVKPTTHAASCYYGANTKWCTTTKESSQYFKQYAEKGGLYYFLNKKNGTKIALFKNNRDKEIEVYDSADKQIFLDDLRELFPNQNDLIDEITGTGQILKNLRGFVRGKITADELESSDESILDVKERTPLGQSVIVIDFGDDDKFFNALDISDDDGWFLKNVTGHYSSYEFIDSYQVESDFKDGYIIYGDLNDENIEKLKQIASIIIPEKQFSIQDDEYRVELSRKLLEAFEKEMDSIVSDYGIEKNNEMMTTANQSISADLNDFLESIGFKLYSKYNEVSTTAANLIMWAARLGTTKTNIIPLFKDIIESNGNGGLGGWVENSYEFQDSDNFDSVSFNRQVEREFDSILEKLEDDSNSSGVKIKEYLEFRNKITSKYMMNNWYTLPKNKEISFKIEGFDKDKMKVNILLHSPTNKSKRVSVSEENFQKLLYQPELFDIFGDSE
jgi:hypothetical protein